jgi:hypothetical protein
MLGPGIFSLALSRLFYCFFRLQQIKKRKSVKLPTFILTVAGAKRWQVEFRRTEMSLRYQNYALAGRLER